MSKTAPGLLKACGLAALALSVAAEYFVSRENVHFVWERIPGAYAVFGFLSCVVIVVIAKLIGKLWLMKKENYYD